MLNYYAQVAPTLLPHLADRAVTRIRWPHGVRRAELLREERPGRHAVLGAHRDGPDDRLPRRAPVADGGDTLVFPIVDDLATLTWLVNLAALELHVHQWTVGPQRPAAQRRPAGHRPRPRRAGRAARVLPGGAAGARQAGRARPGRHARSPAAARACTCTPTCPRRLPSDESTALAKEVAEELQRRAPAAGDRDHDQGPAAGQGVPRLVAERRLEDHHLAVLPARPGAARSSPRRSPGTRSRRAPRTRSASSSSASTQVLDRVARLGDLFAAPT